jgi:hypothetical protein
MKDIPQRPRPSREGSKPEEPKRDGSACESPVPFEGRTQEKAPVQNQLNQRRGAGAAPLSQIPSGGSGGRRALIGADCGRPLAIHQPAVNAEPIGAFDPDEGETRDGQLYARLYRIISITYVFAVLFGPARHLQFYAGARWRLQRRAGTPCDAAALFATLVKSRWNVALKVHSIMENTHDFDRSVGRCPVHQEMPAMTTPSRNMECT